MVIPKLRFKEFDGDWNNSSLLNLSFDKTLSNGVFNDQNKVGKGYKLINVLDMYIERDINESRLSLLDLSQQEFERNKVKYGDIFFTRSSLVKEGIAYSNVYLGSNNDITYDGHLIKLSPNLEQINPIFLNYGLKTSKVRKQLIQGGKTATMTTIGQKEIASTKIDIPLLKEQTKIATFLSAVDEKIAQLSQKLHLLGQYKQGMMQKLFSQQIRFKADDGREFGEWEYKPLNEIAYKNSIKNKDGNITEVLTNSALQGVIKQSDYFDREIVTEANLHGYYLVNINDFVYNPRISVHAPVGPIKRNKKCLGVMSPLYTIFTVEIGNLTYLEYFFDSNFWHDYVKSVANSGARHDRMNITNKDFFEMPVLYPCLEEQTKIANFLSAIDQKMDVVSEQLTQAKTWKKGLLQQMFV